MGTKHQETITLSNIPNAASPVILGMNWAVRHNAILHEGFLVADR
jgi:hypothetical protein